MSRLTALQERFSQQYQVDFDPEAAVLRAGYKVKAGTQEAKKLAEQLMSNDNVQQRIAELRQIHAPLKPRERLACRYFLVDGCSQTEAYRRAGYKDHRTNASRFFAQAKIQRYLRQLAAGIAQQELIDAAWVVRRAVQWVETGFVPITDAIACLEITPDKQVRFRDDPRVTEEMRLSIQEATYSETILENGDFRKELRVKQHRRDHNSLNLLAKYTGVTSDFDAIVRGADKYGFTVVETETGYEFIKTWDDQVDAGEDEDDDQEEDQSCDRLI